MNRVPTYIKEKFDQVLHQTEQTVYVRAPGRINLIGEHTDYNKGLVLPGAIDKYMYFAATPNGTDTIYATALDLGESITLDIHNLCKTDFLWANYMTGILLEFQQRGIELSGFDCVLTSEVPIGAGLSSSSALECAILVGLKEFQNIDLDNWEIIKMSQSSNHNFLGIKGGILDQFSSLFGQRDKIMLLDCDSLEYKYITIPKSNYTWLLINTNVKHNHLNSGYNDRVKECAQALEDIRKTFPDVKNLSALTDPKKLLAINFSSSTIKKRAKYILEENNRVRLFIAALEKSQFQECGTILKASHRGLSQDYEVSCPELDFLVSALEDNPFVLGSRMMGGGFGGCTINLVEKDSIEKIKQGIFSIYQNEFGIEPTFYSVEISGGAERLEGY